jgi:hypothetical protein
MAHVSGYAPFFSPIHRQYHLNLVPKRGFFVEVLLKKYKNCNLGVDWLHIVGYYFTDTIGWFS